MRGTDAYKIVFKGSQVQKDARGAVPGDVERPAYSPSSLKKTLELDGGVPGSIEFK